MLLLLTTMGMHWVRLIQIGPYTLEAYHLGAMALIVATSCSARGVEGVWRVTRSNIAWLTPLAVYLVFLWPAVSGTPGYSILVRQIYFLITAICVAGYVANASSSRRVVRVGSVLGLLAFVLTLQYSALQTGLSLPRAIADFAGSGNMQALIYRFFRPVFNALARETGELAFGAAIGNAIGTSLLVLASLMLASRMRTVRRMDVAGFVSFIIVLGFAVLMNSRSVLIAGIISVLWSTIVGRLAHGFGSWTELMIGVLLFTMVGTIGILIATNAELGFNAVRDSFSFSDASTEGRLEQFQWAVSLINARPLWGNGYLLMENGLPIHNLFLSAWAYVGLIGFLAVVAFYVVVSLSWLRATVMVLTPRRWGIDWRPGWVIALMILPLFRVWISGGGGHPAYAEWVALGTFFGLLVRNDSSPTNPQDGANARRPAPLPQPIRV
jgi:hypothetical protein